MSDNELTLKEFIEENHRLLTVVSVFGALTGVFLSPSIYAKNSFISFLTFIMFLLLSIELISRNNMVDFLTFDNRHRSRNPSNLLKIFSLCFIIFISVIAVQILSDYQSIVSTILRLVIPLFYIYIVAEAINHFDIFKSIRNRRLVLEIIYIIIILLSMKFGDYTLKNIIS